MTFVVFYGDRFIYQPVGNGGNKHELAYRKSEFAKQEYDTVFIGSSRTAFGISPSYFDSLSQRKTKSYNFGIIAGKPPQTFDWCEELIQNSAHLKYVFFELSSGFSENEKQDDPVLTFFKPSIPRREFEEAVIKFNLPLQNIPLQDFLSRKDNPVRQNFPLSKVQHMHSLNLQIEREIPEMLTAYNEMYWHRVTRLITLAESKQIQVRFFIPPRLKTENEIKMVYPIYKKLDEKHKLRVAHDDDSLYQADTSFDYSHLNYRGSKRFTELMAAAFDNQPF
jgi:hypothetical protein